MDLAFSEVERDAVYRAIFERRDCRRFLPEPLPDDLLARLLVAAHHAPSVGFMQPWNFCSSCARAHRFVARLIGRVRALPIARPRSYSRRRQGRGQLTADLKLEGIMESPLNLCITCDRSRHGPVVLGRTIQPEMDLYSTVCAVQNLYLPGSPRAEGLACRRQVSIIDPADLHADHQGYRTASYRSPISVSAAWQSFPDIPPNCSALELAQSDRPSTPGLRGPVGRVTFHVSPFVSR